jgi:predicted lipoprotein with Yx(FWY)xxD motif
VNRRGGGPWQGSAVPDGERLGDPLGLHLSLSLDAASEWLAGVPDVVAHLEGLRHPRGGGSATIGEANAGGLGKILVDSNGRTVYLFEKDTGSKSTCSGACAVQWPPVTTKGKPTVGSGLTSLKVGTTARADGTEQVTYDGHPLYLFKGDSGPGDASGQGVNAFGALWYVLSPAGNEVTASASSSGGTGGY